MYFNPVRIKHETSGRQSLFWLPDAIDSALPGRPQDRVVEIWVDGLKRYAARNIMNMIKVFGAPNQQARRATLGHDCGVFALACLTGEQFEEQTFRQIGGLRVKLGSSADGVTTALAHDNELLLVAKEPQSASIGQEHGVHVMVRATLDGCEPLYASKLGSKGPAVLSTVEACLNFYSASRVVPVPALHSEPYRD